MDLAWQLIGFTLVVGIGSTLALDLWVWLLERLAGLEKTNWGAVGRWLTGLPRGQWALVPADQPFGKGEQLLGWTFHYLVGLAYAAMLPLFWGSAYLTAPTLLPALVVGVVVSSLAGLMILMPGLGGGFFASKTPKPGVVIVYVVVAHIVFALAQYLLALAFAH